MRPRFDTKLGVSTHFDKLTFAFFVTLFYNLHLYAKAISRCAAVTLWVFGATGWSATIILNEEAIKIATPAERQALNVATASLSRGQIDIAALERVLRHLTPEVIDSVGVNTVFSFKDPDKQRAYKTISDWYSAEFLEAALGSGSSGVAYWALRKVGHQQHNSESPELQRVGGVIKDATLSRLIPALERLREAQDPRLRQAVLGFLETNGLLVDRDGFMKILQQPDEALVERTLRSQIDRLGIDPGLTKEIWAVLIRATDEQLKVTALRYRWLFDLPVFPEEYLRFIEMQLAALQGGGVLTNLNSALSQLAISENPLAPAILQSLAGSEHEAVRQRALGYQREYERARAGRRQASN